MRAQGGLEAMVVISCLIFILLSMTTYAYYIAQQLEVFQQEADDFDECSKLEALLVSSTLSDRETVTYFLNNITVDGDKRVAYTTAPGTDLLCHLLVPAIGNITLPSNWYYPVNGTRFVGSNGLVNITWGLYR